jgi:large subunit ribosomal protein L15
LPLQYQSSHVSPPFTYFLQVRPASAATFFTGNQLQQRVAPIRAARVSTAVVTANAGTAEVEERFRLNNLSPQPGSKRPKKRKGRGYGAGQGGTGGFGMRGQKSRSGSGIRPGFEGGQTPLYRKLPKLRGIAGGMGAGLPDYVTVNLRDLKLFAEGEEVTLESLQEKRILNLSGRETKLPLKVLGTGELSTPLTIHAAAFSDSAKEKIEAAGGKAVEVAVKAKWTRKAHEAAVAAATNSS